MTLGSPLFDTSLLTASWVSSAMAASGPSAKSTTDDLYSFMPQQQQSSNSLDFVSMLGGGFAQPTFSSPPEAANNFEATAASGPTSSSLSGPGLRPSKSNNAKAEATDDTANALQLDMVDGHTLSPSTTADFDNATCGGSVTPGTQSGYASPAFQLSPTPGLTMCSTVDSTPAPRTNSRCSSRSSFSYPETEGTRSGLTSATGTPASTPGSIRKVIGGHHGRKNSAVANGTFTPKRPHLCTYPDCERSTRTFRSNADLQRHLRSHKGERPYSCPAQNCGKAYGQQNKMVKHVEQQHPMLLPRVEMNRTRTRRAAAAVVVNAAARNRAPSHGSALSIAASAYPMAYAQHVAKQGQVQAQGHHHAGQGQRSEGRPFHTSPLTGTPQYGRPAPYPHPAALALAQQQQMLQRSQQHHSQSRYGSLGQGIQLQPSGNSESQWWAKALGNQ